jgi:hypothetical protein
VDRLDQRGRLRLQSDAQGRTLSPIAENTSAARIQAHFVACPVHSCVPALPPAAPPTPRAPPRRRTLVAEARCTLLSGAPQSHASSLVHAATSIRRQSLPATGGGVAVSGARRPSLDLQELQAWGHIYFGNGTTADAFVRAVSLRRLSESNSAVDAKSDHEYTEKFPPTQPPEEKPKSSYPNRLTLRARIWPKALERKPFLIQRSFDLDELRATILGPPPAPTSSRSDLVRSRGASLSLGGTSFPTARVTGLTPRESQLTHARRRPSSSFREPGFPPFSRGPRSDGTNLDSRAFGRRANAVPIRKFQPQTSTLAIVAASAPLFTCLAPVHS